MSTFDPQSFLDATVDSSMDTKLIPVPIGEYGGTIEDIEIKTWQSKDDPSKSGIKLECKVLLDDAGGVISEATGREKNYVSHQVMLDTLPGGGLDVSKGKNVGLGRLREAVDLNRPGEPFSFRMLQGRRAKYAIKHRPYNGDLFADVGAVTALV